MSTEALVHVARLGNGSVSPDAIWLDMRTMRFVVVPGDDGEPTATPVDDYLIAHPDRAESVREALRSRFAPPTVIPGAGAAFLARRPADADAMIRSISPENRHPETQTGPAVGNEVW